VLGFDILLDEQLNPWLLEINISPGFHLLTDVVREHHPKFVASMFKVILDNRDKWEGKEREERPEDEQLFASLRWVYSG